MYCDYNELENYAVILDTIFKKINTTMDALEDSYKVIYNSANWNSQTRNYFYNQVKEILSNMESVNSKFYNIKIYLDTVVENYRRTEQGISSYMKF